MIPTARFLASGRGCLALVVAALTLPSSGCLDFERQMVVMVFPKDGKTVQALFIYDGLHVSRGDKPKDPDVPDEKDLQLAKETLAEMVRGDTIVLGDPIMRLPFKSPKGEKAGIDDDEIFQLFKPLVTIHPGLFLPSADGKFAYCQPVTLRDPQAVIAGLNQMIGKKVLEELNINQ